MHNPDMNRVKWVQTATHGDAIRVLSSVFIIGQNDTRNRVILFNELVAEKSLKQLLFE